MSEAPPWVMDTSAYTHLCRAGHGDLIKQLAPQGVVLVPAEVSGEIEEGRARYSDIPSVNATSWAQVHVLTDLEVWTMLEVKAQMGGDPRQHLGECAVIACAKHRGMIAILDERAAIEQAEQRKVAWHDTLWIVVEAYKRLFDQDRDRAAQVVDALLDTGMRLPIKSGESLFAWAYQEGILP